MLGARTLKLGAQVNFQQEKPRAWLIEWARGRGQVEAFVEQGGTFVATYFSGITDECDLAFEGYPGPLRRVIGDQIDLTVTLGCRGRDTGHIRGQVFRCGRPARSRRSARSKCRHDGS